MKQISEVEDKLSRRLENICSQTCILGQCGKKNVLHCAPSLSAKAKLWALEAMYKKLPLIDTALYIMLLMRASPLLGQVGGGRALEILTFLGPKWHSPDGLLPFSLGPKSLDFQGPTPSHLSS
jgi:hypothetical protein